MIMNLMKRSFLLLALLACSVQLAAAQTTIFLVRHAEKATGEGVDAEDPELSEAGRARAESLALMLKDARLTAVYATEFKRTQQTAAPTARAAAIGVTTVASKDIDSLVAKLKGKNGNVLVVGHSNTLPEIMKALGVLDSMTIEEADYDNLFVVTRGSPSQLLRLHYASCVR